MATTFAGASQHPPDTLTQLPVRARASATRIDRWLAARVQQTIDPAPVRVVLWDSTSPYHGPDPPLGDLVLHDRGALLGLVLNPDLWFGEAYTTGRLEVRGPLEPVLEALSRSSAAEMSWRDRMSAVFGRANTLTSARRNVRHHYDLGNDFYRLWLDPEMVYTCAYYATLEAGLEEAQRAKLDLVCRKLRLRPGESVIEAGCGWGALALHMARHYGVVVKAFNVSREQLAFARDRARREGLSDRVEFIDDDYRNVKGRFDVFVSVGMLEHVGRTNLGTVAGVLRRCVHRTGGRGLLHFIGRDAPRPVNTWIRRRIFPGGYTPTLAEVTSRVLAPAGMSAVDVENLRLHYARTLKHWGDRFSTVQDHVRSAFGEEFRRAWELYLAGSEAAFAAGWLQLFQIVFAPRESAPPFWTRRDPHPAREMCGDPL
jgi:cyclopropane-fatty-acyl-phospholipid synthase